MSASALLGSNSIVCKWTSTAAVRQVDPFHSPAQNKVYIDSPTHIQPLRAHVTPMKASVLLFPTKWSKLKSLVVY